MLVKILFAAVLVLQGEKDPNPTSGDASDVPELADAALGEDGFAGEGGLDASYSASEPYTGRRTVICEFEFQAGRRRPRDLEVRCPAGDLTDAVEARAFEVMSWETRRNTDSQMRRDRVRGQLVLRRNLTEPDRPDWLADTTMVLGAVPSYPNSQAARGHSASCLIAFHVIDNQAETQDAVCLTTGLHEAFERVSSRVVERYVFVGDEDVYCQQTQLSFWMAQTNNVLPLQWDGSTHRTLECDIPDEADE